MHSLLFKLLLIFAMAMPMMILFSVSALGPFFSEQLNIQTGMTGYIVCIAFGLASLLSLWAPAFVKRFGVRLGLITLFGSVTVAFTLLLVLPDYVGLVWAAACCGIGQALANPVTNVLIKTHCHAGDQTPMIGLKQAGVQLAALISGVPLAYIAVHWGWQFAFGTLVPVALFFLLLSWRIKPVAGSKHTGTLSRPNTLLIRLMSTQFFVALSLSAFVTFLPAFATSLAISKQSAAQLIAVFGVTGMLSRIYITPMARKFDDDSYFLLLLCVISCLSLSTVLVTTSNSTWLLLPATLGIAGTAVTSNALAMSMLMRDRQFGDISYSSALVSVAFFAGYALGPLLFGYSLNQEQNFNRAWFVVLMTLLLAIIAALLLIIQRKKQRAWGC